MSKRIEIFCGTGGVGKTTLATARALQLATCGKKILLITIDPAKRLKEVLSLPDDDRGQVHRVPAQQFKEFCGEREIHLDALLMSPKSTMERMGKEQGTLEDLDNPIIKILTRPNGGMNEIMATIEVQHYLKSGDYDLIILDTPPGKHFIDFLVSSKKINSFFDKTFIEIFKYVGKSIGKSEKTGLFQMVVSSGVKKLLSYLGKVTGADFVDTFIDAIIGLYKTKDSFLEALRFQENLKIKEFSNWFLVTSVEQQKMEEAQEMREGALQFMHSDSYLGVNKCLGPHLSDWNPSSREQQTLKDSMRDRENRLKEAAGKSFDKVLEFPVVLGASPNQHVIELARAFQDYDPPV